jgi:hypothetical protein
VYFADVLNSRGLFQHLGGWVGASNVAGIQSRSQVVLQRAYQVLFHLEQCAQLEQIARSQFNSHAKSVANLPQTLQGWSPLVAGLIIELSGAMATLRILQNDVWQLATVASDARNAPSSMRDAFKNISRKYAAGERRPKWLMVVPQEIRQFITTYWASSGESVAVYRDVDQHHDVLARGCFILTDNNGVNRVSIRLPDNPESKSRGKFSYENCIDGWDLAHSAFSALHDLVENFATFYGALPAPLRQTIEFAPAIQHESGVARVTAIVLNDNDGRSGHVIGQDEEMRVTITQTAR